MTALAPASTSQELVDLDDLRPHPANRKRFDQAELEELARSLTTVGQLTPAIVRPIVDPEDGRLLGYELLAGERRWRAAKIAGLPQLMVIVRDLTDEQALEVLAIENNQREDPDALDEAELFKAMLTLKSYSVAKISGRLKRSETYIRERLRLLRLTKEAQTLVIEGTIPVQHAALLATLSPADQARAMKGQRMNGSAYAICGLFREERTLFDDERDTRVPVSVAEFRDWIRREVRLDPRAEVAAELFPETVAAVAHADGNMRKVLSLTTDYLVSDAAKDAKERTIGHDHWKRADGKKGSKTCPYAELGVVVAGEAQGEAFAVCIRKDKCATHWPAESKAAAARVKEKAAESTGSAKSGDPAWDKALAEQAKAKEAEAVAARVKELERWAKAEPQLIGGLIAGVRKQPAGADSKAGKYLLAECWNNSHLKKQFTPSTAADLVQYLYLSHLLDNYVFRFTDTSAIAEVTRLCKAHGVDATKIVDQVAPKGKPKPAKKLAGDVRRAKKAGKK